MSNGDCIIEMDDNKLDDEDFRRSLREDQGIYFDVNVFPSSPRKVISPKIR